MGTSISALGVSRSIASTPRHTARTRHVLDHDDIRHRHPKSPRIIDVRTDETFAADPRLVPGAVRRPASSIAEWRDAFRSQTAIVVCQHGHALSHALLLGCVRRDLVVKLSLDMLPFWLFFVLITAMMAMFTWADATLGALSTTNLGQVAGTAASAFGAIQAMGATLLGSLIGQGYDGTPGSLVWGSLILGIVCLLAIVWARRASSRE